MIESLYNEVLRVDSDLKTLEDKITNLGKAKSDSLDRFENFNEKNGLYYDLAEKRISAIKDSLLRDKLKTLIINSLTTYSLKIANHKELMTTIETNSITISDLHTSLKIVTTLPIIEKFQADNFPKSQAIEGYIKQQQDALKMTDTLFKKRIPF